MTKDIFSNQYWEKAWEDDPNTQDKRMKRAGLAIHRHQVLKSGQKTLIKILLLKKASTVRNGL